MAASVTGTLWRMYVALRTTSAPARADASDAGSSTSTRTTRSGASSRRSNDAADSGRMSPMVTSWPVRSTRSATAAEPISPDPPRTRMRLIRAPYAPPRAGSARRDDLVGRVVHVGHLDREVAVRKALGFERREVALVRDPQVDGRSSRDAG